MAEAAAIEVPEGKRAWVTLEAAWELSKMPEVVFVRQDPQRLPVLGSRRLADLKQEVGPGLELELPGPRNGDHG